MHLIQEYSRKYGTYIGLCDLFHFLVVIIFKFGWKNNEYNEVFVIYMRGKKGFIERGVEFFNLSLRYGLLLV